MGMTINRIKLKEHAYYHCMTRIVGREMLLGEAEKEHMRTLIRKIEGFTGIHVLTYAIMTNHVHLLLEEPDRDTVINDQEFRTRMACLYDDVELSAQFEIWEQWESDGCADLVKIDRNRYIARMHDISEFMKQLKQRFSRWYNRVHQRKGALWDARFKSVLVEPGTPLRTVAAYIELNPVRARLVDNPRIYRFCGIADAMNGNSAAQKGVRIIVDAGDVISDWNHISTHYLEHVLMYNEMRKTPKQLYIDYDTLHEKIRNKLPLTEFERLMCHSRYFSDGCIIGSKPFVEQFFNEHREQFGDRRLDGARKVKGGWTELFAIRELAE